VTRWWRAASIRVRLTAWYSGVLTLMLVVYAGATYLAVRHEFHEQLEQEEHVTTAASPVDPELRIEEQLDEILVVLVLGLPLVVGLAGVGGYLLARRALTPIDHLAADARRITAERLHERLSVANEHDEIGRLAAVVNDTFARLESSFDQLRRFTADASHELRTPLAVIRGIGELGLGETRTAAEYKDAIGSMLEEVDRLSRLVDTLLQLSRGDAGTVRLSPVSLDLSDLARDVASSLAILAEERRQLLQVHAPEPVPVRADRLVLRDAIANLVDNAIKYGPTESPIDITVRADTTEAALTVSDQGPGIPIEHRERIFDRFYRVDEGRAREMGGTGLGLAIARWAVEANGGRISFVPTGDGAAFRISLPLSSGAMSGHAVTALPSPEPRREV
jgi:heavy metal sensor kinase